jgi:octaprenyl-diphosphate synthase
MIVKPTMQGSDLANVYLPVSDSLAEVERILQAELSSETPWVGSLLEHNWIKGGKRIRPLLLLLSGSATGTLNQNHHYLAAAVEMIHAATLVHDDVIDQAEIRRHLPTVNSAWGNRSGVLLGDYLFTHAFYVASLANDPSAIGVLAASSNRVCEGEIQQNAWQGRLDISEAEYFEMISGKTGELCSCSCQLGALLSGATEEVVNQLTSYGLQLGIAFQIIDDVLDLAGLQQQVGKTLGTDLSNRKLTLPLIHALEVSSPEEKAELKKLLSLETVPTGTILLHLQRSDSIDYARSIAQQRLQQAIQSADQLPDSPAARALVELATFVLNRAH